MDNGKSMASSMASSTKLSKFGAIYVHDATFFRSIVGALQYATKTRPEISYYVNKVCQFLSYPLEEHWKAVKRILRYVQGTLNHGLDIEDANPTKPIAKTERERERERERRKKDTEQLYRFLPQTGSSPVPLARPRRVC